VLWTLSDEGGNILPEPQGGFGCSKNYAFTRLRIAIRNGEGGSPRRGRLAAKAIANEAVSTGDRPLAGAK
jgi:hypothetical protein